MSDNVTSTVQQQIICQALRRVLEYEGPVPKLKSSSNPAHVGHDSGDSFGPIDMNLDSILRGWNDELSPEQLAEIELAVGQIRGI
jgi:hypothetical protein